MRHINGPMPKRQVYSNVARARGGGETGDSGGEAACERGGETATCWGPQHKSFIVEIETGCLDDIGNTL